MRRPLGLGGGQGWLLGLWREPLPEELSEGQCGDTALGKVPLTVLPDFADSPACSSPGHEGQAGLKAKISCLEECERGDGLFQGRCLTSRAADPVRSLGCWPRA